MRRSTLKGSGDVESPQSGGLEAQISKVCKRAVPGAERAEGVEVEMYGKIGRIAGRRRT